LTRSFGKTEIGALIAGKAKKPAVASAATIKLTAKLLRFMVPPFAGLKSVFQ
jgi:hypothetical protein